MPSYNVYFQCDVKTIKPESADRPNGLTPLPPHLPAFSAAAGRLERF
jgi:hypothetical protein